LGGRQTVRTTHLCLPSAPPPGLHLSCAIVGWTGDKHRRREGKEDKQSPSLCSPGPLFVQTRHYKAQVDTYVATSVRTFLSGTTASSALAYTLYYDGPPTILTWIPSTSACAYPAARYRGAQATYRAGCSSPSPSLLCATTHALPHLPYPTPWQQYTLYLRRAFSPVQYRDCRHAASVILCLCLQFLYLPITSYERLTSSRYKIHQRRLPAHCAAL